MIKQYIAEKDAKTILAAGVRNYYTLEPRQIRQEKRFSKWADEALAVFGFDQKRGNTK